MIDDWGMLTLWVYDTSDRLDEGDMAPCGSMMKGTGSTFISFIQDLWALPHQVLQQSQVTLLRQLINNKIIKYNKSKDGETAWCYTHF